MLLTIKRAEYWQKLQPFIDKPVIKVITGLRRAGKSYFLRQIMDELKLQFKIDEANIIYINKELLEFDFIKDYKDLDQYIKDQCKKSKVGKKYLFVDEVQEIEEWERTLRSYLAKEDFDIYVTGSNATMLSSELATFLTGRYIEIQVYPLSYAEFLQFRKQQNSRDEFNNYLRFGGMPALHQYALEQESIYPILEAVLNTIVLKDVVARHELRNNISNFEAILKFAFDNIASTFSAKSLTDYLKSQRINMGVATVQNYLSFLESAFLVNQVRRYDIKGKRHLEIYEKYYVADLGLRHALLGYKESDISDYLENIVYQELRRRGFEVSIGKLNGCEVDFIATKSGQKIYIQVTYLLANAEIREREFKPLLAIADNYPKLVLSMDEYARSTYEGIESLNLQQWLL